MPDDDRLLGTVVRDADGRELGAVTGLHVDPDGRAARWLDLELTSGGRAVLPVQAASVDAAGRVVVPFRADEVRSAPRADGPVVTADLAEALLRHYGFPPETR
ncbi:PRC-barrel domain-containing protein [Jatrophihabitans sp. YIM 134969]